MPQTRLVEVELVQTPRKQSEKLIFDVYLKNLSAEDILLTSLTYGSSFTFASSNINRSRKFFPDASYTIPLVGTSEKSFALSPPYLLAAGSPGAIRFEFVPEARTNPVLSTMFAFELYDSKNIKAAAINGYVGK